MTLVLLVFALGANEASGQLCDREGYVRHGVNCPNEARDATGCCQRPRPAARPPCEIDGQVRSAATRGECCWPGQRWRQEACSGGPTRCPLGWTASRERCEPLHQSVVGWDYPEALGPTRGIRRQSLGAAFHELGQARRELSDSPAQAAGHYEAAVDILVRVRHPRAHVFRYHAASAWERAGQHERAVSQLGRYLRARGEDPPVSSTRRVGLEVQLAAWGEQPSWEVIGPRWAEIQEAGFEEAGTEVLGHLASAFRAVESGRHREAAESYDALQTTLWRVGQRAAWPRLHAAAAWSRARDRTRAAESYAVYLALDGEDPPPHRGPVVAESVREAARERTVGWEEHFSAGIQAAEMGRHAEAQTAFQNSFVSVEGHPNQAMALLQLGASQKAARQGPAARATLDLAMRRARPEVRSRAEAGWRAARGTLATYAPWNHCQIDLDGAVLCVASDRPTTRFPTLRALRLAAVGENYCAITPERRVYCWGVSRHARLGEADWSHWTEPVQWQGLNETVEVVGGRHHMCGLHSEGRVQCWEGDLGRELAGGTPTAPLAPPQPVAGLSDAIQIVAGAGHTCALRAGGTVACWARNRGRQLGPAGEPQDPARPTEVPRLQGVATISAGAYHTCALRSEGSIHCWGRNDRGQLGDGTSEDRTDPIPVPGLSNAVEVTSGPYHTCARLRSEAIHCWGELVPWTVWVNPREVSRVDRVVEMAGGPWSLCTMHQDGHARCWQFQPSGRLRLNRGSHPSPG